MPGQGGGADFPRRGPKEKERKRVDIRLLVPVETSPEVFRGRGRMRGKGGEREPVPSSFGIWGKAEEGQYLVLYEQEKPSNSSNLPQEKKRGEGGGNVCDLQFCRSIGRRGQRLHARLAPKSDPWGGGGGRIARSWANLAPKKWCGAIYASTERKKKGKERERGLRREEGST